MPAPRQAPLTTDELRLRRIDARARRRRRQRNAAVAVVAVVAIVVVAVVAMGSGGSGGAPKATAAATPTLHTIATVLNAPATPITDPPKPGAYERSLELKAIHRAAKAHDYVVSGTPRHKLIALTFDDGPGPTTPRIVKWLVKHQVPATFFLIGAQVNSFPDMARTEARDGFVLGDHTENHKPLATLSAAGQQQQIVGGFQSIKDTTGRHVHLFRPPEGSFNPTTLQILKSHGLLMVLWSVDTSDYAMPGVDKIVFTALSGARAGGIILMHDGGGDRTETLHALPRIVHALRLKGYHLVTVPQLLVRDPVPKNQPAPHSLSGG
jgi:peptidoglycan-N-acetylglucosamine deacetylase